MATLSTHTGHIYVKNAVLEKIYWKKSTQKEDKKSRWGIVSEQT